MKILIGNSSSKLGNLNKIAERKRWDVTQCNDIEDAVFYASEVNFQLIFVFIGGNSNDRFSMLNSLGHRELGCPIIAVLEQDCSIERAQAWLLGALVCLTTTASPKELEMATLAALRYSMGQNSQFITNGSLALNVPEGTFRLNKLPISLTRKQFLLLEKLMLCLGRTVTRAQIMNHLYGFETFPKSKIIDVMVCKLRTKLEEHGVDSSILKTVWGVGYRLEKVHLDLNQNS